MKDNTAPANRRNGRNTGALRRENEKADAHSGAVVPNMLRVSDSDGTKSSGKSKITYEQEKKIVEGHRKRWTTTKTAEYAKVSSATVWKVWKRKGLGPTHKRGGQSVTQEQEKKIIEGHGKGWTTTKTAEYAEVNQTTVGKVWKRKGLGPTHKRGRPSTRSA